MAAPTVRNSSSAVAAEQKKLLAAILQGGAKASGVPTMAGPAEGMYGVFSNAYVNKLGESTGAAGADLLNQMTLRSGAQLERQEYAKMIEQSRIAQAEAQRRGYIQEMEMKVADGYLDAVGKGVGGAYGTASQRDANGNPIFRPDPVITRKSDQRVASGQEADIFKTNADGLKTAAEAGYGLSVLDARQKLTPTGDQYLADINPAFRTPGDSVAQQNANTTRYAADEGLTAEQQMQMAAAENEARAKGLQGKYQYNPQTKSYEWVVTGPLDKMDAYNPDAKPPPTMPNPKADGNGSVPSATPATEYYSNPNSKRGMRRDPITGQQRMHKGDDFARKANTPFPAERDGTVQSVGNVKGFGPNTVIVEYDDGERVLYGHGNAASVKPGQRVQAGMGLGLVGSQGRSTGPHVHRQQLNGPTRVVNNNAPKRPDGTPTRINNPNAVMAARAKQLGAQITWEGDTMTAVMPDKSVIKFRGGKRVG